MLLQMLISPRKTLSEKYWDALSIGKQIREDADLSYLSIQPKTGKRGRPAKYGGKIDLKKLNSEFFNLVVNHKGITAYSASYRLKIKACKLFSLFFGTALQPARYSFQATWNIQWQTPIDVIDIYHTRFQIEFGFRDAKQFAGLENSQARSGNMLNFHFNAALTTVNIAKVMQLTRTQSKIVIMSMNDCISALWLLDYS